MRALTWHGKNDIRCDTVPDPKIEHGRDAIIKVTACAICGSDLHLFDGVMPSMEKGDVLGHETMGEVVEVGSENNKLKIGDRVVVPFTISCGECFFCKKGFFSGCERSNPNHTMAEKLWARRRLSSCEGRTNGPESLAVKATARVASAAAATVAPGCRNRRAAQTMIGNVR